MMLKRWWTALSATALLAGGLAVAALPPPHGGEDDPMLLVSRNGAPGHGPMHFRLEGKPVRGLHPGATKQMSLTVINPYDFRLRLEKLTGKVTSSVRRGCPATATNLVVRDFTGALPITIEPHRRTQLRGTLPVFMPGSASQKCAGARFTITVSASGNQVPR